MFRNNRVSLIKKNIVSYNLWIGNEYISVTKHDLQDIINACEAELQLGVKNE